MALTCVIAKEAIISVQWAARSANLWWVDIWWVERTMKLVLLGFKASLESLDHDPSLVRNSFKSHVVDSNPITAQWV